MCLRRKIRLWGSILLFDCLTFRATHESSTKCLKVAGPSSFTWYTFASCVAGIKIVDDGKYRTTNSQSDEDSDGCCESNPPLFFAPAIDTISTSHNHFNTILISRLSTISRKMPSMSACRHVADILARPAWCPWLTPWWKRFDLEPRRSTAWGAQ